MNIDPATMLPEVEKMLHQRAWRTAQTTMVPYEEALSECHNSFMNACRLYKPDKGQKFSSYCYFVVAMEMKSLITRRTNDPLPKSEEIQEELVGEAPAERWHGLELLEDLSGDAKEILRLLLETPGELLGGKPSEPGQLYQKVKWHLRDKGGTLEEFLHADTEIRSRLQEAWA
jgi:hypothetical protein